MKKKREHIAKYLSQFKETKKINLYGPLEFKTFPYQNEIPHICVDGGSRILKSLPHGMSIGDGDSSEPDAFMDLKLSKVKNISDLGFTLSILKDFNEFNLYGFIGKRLDHQLANFGEINIHLQNAQDTIFNLENKIIATNINSFKFEHQGLFSIFSLTDCTLSIQGDCQYQLENKPISKLSSLTLSNIAFGTVLVCSNAPIFIFKS